MSKTTTDEKNEIINELLSEWPIYDDVSFSEFDIVDKMQVNPYKLMKYQDQLNTEKDYLDKLNDLFEKLQGEQYHKYRFELDEELNKSEIEKYYLPKDPKIQKMKKLIRKQKIRVQFFEACVKGLDRQHWAIKNYLDERK
jgi:hypothetical protein